MGRLIPGSTTFQVKLLCPCCGWHFKDGLTDPEGRHTEASEDFVLVCGQCLRVLKSFKDGERIALKELSKSEIDALPDDIKEAVKRDWLLSYLTLLQVGPEPRGPAQ